MMPKPFISWPQATMATSVPKNGLFGSDPEVLIDE
jgi:hypothetical protein